MFIKWLHATTAILYLTNLFMVNNADRLSNQYSLPPSLVDQSSHFPYYSNNDKDYNNGHNHHNHNQHHNNHNNKNAASGCALILLRIFPKHLNRNYAPSFKAMLEALRGNSINYGMNGQHQLCISYQDVNNAIQKAMNALNYVRPNQIDSLEPPPEQIAETAEVIQEATRILTYDFELSHDEILNGLPLIDLSKTIFWSHCPASFKPMVCKVERYRTYTAHCNNLENPSWGAANTAFVRYLPPVYSNGIDGLRQSVIKSKMLPNPRIVTRSIHEDFDNPSSDMTILVMSWGQFIDHDLAMAMPPRFFIDGKETEIDCCKLPEGVTHPLCMSFQIPPNDRVYGPRGKDCHDFKRSIAGHRPNCALGPRVHVNTLTSPIDANFLYGSTKAVALRLRTFQKGMLKVWDVFHERGYKPLLPPEDENPDLECTGRPRNMFCFLAGDVRVNEQIHLTVLHTLYVRDHNRMALELGKLNPHWGDERIYQETRHIIAASVQHITLNEFLPEIIGENLIKENDLGIIEEGYFNGYDSQAHTSPSQAFTTAAFRFGHTFIQSKVRRYNKYHDYLGEHSLRYLLRRPFMIYEPGKLDELALGLVNTPAQTYDPFISKEVSGHLFQELNEVVGFDLPAINLMRGREQGVPGYNFYREWCGLPKAQNFEELIAMMGNKTAYLYSTMYAHPDDIDLWSGGVSEHPLPHALVGPTFGCIIARNFANIRKGDRFWFENPGFPSSFTPAQLRQIRKATQAKIICENGDNILTIQKWALRQYNPKHNPRIRCDKLPSIDLRYFKEDPDNGGFPFDQDYYHRENSIDY